MLDDRFRGLTLLVIEWKEQHPDAIFAARRKFEAELARFAAQELMRNLQEHAGAVAGARIASACTAMGQVVEDLDALAHDIVRALTLDVDHEADPACVVLVSRRVEALCRRYAAVLMHDHTLLGSATIVFTMPWRCLRA